MKRTILLILTITLFVCALACAKEDENVNNVDQSLGNRPIDFPAGNLTWEIQNIFGGDTVKNETVMFIDKGDTKSLLYKIDTVISVTSYDGKKTYTEGEDYEVVNGKLRVTENSSIPCITSEKYYGGDGSLMTEHDGKMLPTYWGEGTVMTNWQVNVTYTHSDTWKGYRQPCYATVYENLFRKFENGEDITILFYGDSCTYGAASSFAYGYAPYQYSYALLVTNALADIYGYTVKYLNTRLRNVGPIPRKDYAAGTNGTITYINTSVGGWTTQSGIDNLGKHVYPFIEEYGCDLFVLDLGGNDGGTDPAVSRANEETIIDSVLDKSPDTAFIVMSTLLNRPGSNWEANDRYQEPLLKEMTEMYREKGVPCALCGITSMTASMLKYIKFEDFSGNNINHPNDFWARAYACTLFETLVGYENLK